MNHRILLCVILLTLVPVGVWSGGNDVPSRINSIQSDEDGEQFIPTKSMNDTSSISDSRPSLEVVEGSGTVDGTGVNLVVTEEDNNSNDAVNGSSSTTAGTESWPYWFDTGCAQWLPVNHVYFQLANTFLFLSYLAPAGIYGLLYLRLMLAIGCAFFAIWGWLILCAFDTFLWNAFFTLINVVQGTILLCSMRPVRFDKQVEEVYQSIFQPLKVSKQQFKKVVNCMKCIRALKRGEHFAIEKQTRVETLSLLLSGSMLVSENKRTLHVLSPMQFLDSPEWFGISSDDFFQVSIRACEESRVLQWHRDKLKLILLSDAFLSAVFEHILGIDVVRKLTQMKEKISSPIVTNSSPFRNNMVDTDKSLASSPLSAKSSVHEHGGVVTEKYTLLDEEQLSGKNYGRSGTNLADGRKSSTGLSIIRPGNKGCDYSVVQHLDSTDI